MIFTVGIVVVNGEAFVDPRLDTSTPVIRDIVSETARDQDSFEFLTVEIVPRGTEEISNAVRNMIERNSLNLVLVVGGIGFEESDCTPEAVEPFIERPAIAVVNRILANVQDPFIIRPSAGVSGQTLIVTLPGNAEDLRNASSCLLTSAPGLYRLLKLLKNGHVQTSRVSSSTEARHDTPGAPDATPEQVLPIASSPRTIVASQRLSGRQEGTSESPWRWFRKGGREASENSTNNTHRDEISRFPQSQSPMPATSETPWRCFEITMGAEISAPNSSQGFRSQPVSIPDVSFQYFSLAASPKGELYMFGGYPGHGLSRLSLDIRKGVAAISNIHAAGVEPPRRYGHSAVWISESLIVVWGGYDISKTGPSDTDLHIFNTETLTWTTLSMPGPAPQPRFYHAMACIGTKLYVYGGCDPAEIFPDLWCLDFNTLSDLQRRQNPQWQCLSMAGKPNDLPIGQYHHSLVTCGNDIILLGTKIHDNAIYSWSTETLRWKKRCSLGLDGYSHSGAALLGDTIYSHSENSCGMFNTSNNVWLDNPSTYSKKGLRGPMAAIGSKIYVFGISPSDASKVALYELDTEKIWLPTRAEYDLAKALRK